MGSESDSIPEQGMIHAKVARALNIRLRQDDYFVLHGAISDGLSFPGGEENVISMNFRHKHSHVTLPAAIFEHPGRLHDRGTVLDEGKHAGWGRVPRDSENSRNVAYYWSY